MLAFFRFFGILGFLSFGFYFFSIASARAQVIPQYADWGAQTWGRAGVGAPLSQGLEAFSNNPAGLVRQLGRASFGGQYLNLPGNGSSWSLGLIDGLQEVIGGFNFQYHDQSPYSRQSYQLGAAYNTSYGAAGVTANIYRFAGSGAPDKGWKVSQSVGLLIPLGFGFQIGGFGQAFFDNIKASLQAPRMALGAAYDWPDLGRLGFQADRIFEVKNADWNYSMSAEIILQEFFVARGGYRFDNSPLKDFWTIGAGLEAPKMQIDGFYMLSADSSNETAWGFQVQFLF